MATFLSSIKKRKNEDVHLDSARRSNYVLRGVTVLGLLVLLTVGSAVAGAITATNNLSSSYNEAYYSAVGQIILDFSQTYDAVKTDAYEAALADVRWEAYLGRVQSLQSLSAGMDDDWAMKVYAGENGIATLTVQPSRLLENFQFVRIYSFGNEGTLAPVFRGAGSNSGHVFNRNGFYTFAGPGITEVDRFYIDFFVWSDPMFRIEVCIDAIQCEEVGFGFQQGILGGEHSTQFDMSGPFFLEGYQLYTSGYKQFRVDATGRYGDPVVWAGMSNSYVAAIYPSTE